MQASIINTSVTVLARSLCVLALVALVGCSSRPSLEKLEEEAMRTDDWSEVDKRIRMERSMGWHDPDEKCPSGEALLCSKKGEREFCECVSPHILR